MNGLAGIALVYQVDEKLVFVGKAGCMLVESREDAECVKENTKQVCL